MGSWNRKGEGAGAGAGEVEKEATVLLLRDPLLRRWRTACLRALRERASRAGRAVGRVVLGVGIGGRMVLEVGMGGPVGGAR